MKLNAKKARCREFFFKTGRLVRQPNLGFLIGVVISAKADYGTAILQ